MDLDEAENVDDLFGNPKDIPTGDCIDVMKHFLLYYFCDVGWNETILLYNFAEDVFEVEKEELLESFHRFCKACKLPEMNVSILLATLAIW